MHYAVLLLTIVLASVSIKDTKGQSNSKNSEPVTVKYVDLKKYAGTWYEIAKIPNWFQKGCVKNTTANYKIIDNENVQVINRCIEDDGSTNEAEGLAKVVDKKTGAKLEVSFVKILGIRLFWGDYWIIGLDEDYKFAVIGIPSRKYGWILCRTPQMPKEDLDKAYSILREQGYNPANFKMTVQE